MKYKELEKFLYQSEEAYRAEYQKRKDAETSVHIDFAIGRNRAFFVQSSEVIELMYNILRCDKEVLSLCSMLPEIAKIQYQRKCLIDEIVLTNNIEGVHSSRKEIGDALELLEERSSKRTGRRRFEGIVSKYRKLTLGEALPLDTCRDIRDIYDELVLDEVVSESRKNAPDGKYFRKDAAIIYSKAGEMLHIGVDTEEKIIESMDKLLAFLKDDSIDSLYRVCLFHYMFEYIHPFYDGNGRLGRFIMSYSISRELQPLLAYRISETIKENIGSYYKAFKTCSESRNLGDVTPFLIMMLSMISKAEEELKTSLSSKLTLLDRYSELAAKKYPYIDSELLFVLIQASLFSETGISIKDLVGCLGITYQTLTKRLKTVREKNLLVEKIQGKRKYFELDISLLDKKMIEN